MKWATRPRVHIDRAGCAWLICRYLDPDAEFIFAADPSNVPAGAIAFDVRGVELGHRGGDCSFETILHRYEQTDPVLWKLAELVHEADLDDEPFDAPEAPGLASTGALGLVFFAVGVLQTASFLVATGLAERFGLLSTMAFTHLPSNVLLAAIAFAPDLPVAVALLLARSVLSQMDVPTRQAYVMALVEPSERTAAAGYTNTARYVVRPLGPVLAGAGQGLFFGFPFLAAGVVKAAYDLVLWRWFQGVRLLDDHDATAAPQPRSQAPAAAVTAEEGP